MGLVIGGGVVVFDFDDLAAYARWCDLVGELASTYTERTRRGFHVFVRGDPGSLVGVEVKRGGAIVLAPSLVGDFVYQVVQAGPILQAGPVGAAELRFPLLSEARESFSPGACDLIGRIKQAWPILRLAERLTALSTRGGRWYSGRCPFHDDDSPSFWVDVQRGLFGCFACSVRGDVINLYALAHGLTVQNAIAEMGRYL